jgi:hypothetical protein
LASGITRANVVSESKPKEKPSLGGLTVSKKSFGFGSYNRTIDKSNQKQEAKVNDKDYAMVTVPTSGSQIYNSDAKPQVLNT